MTKSTFDLILGMKALRELGIVLNCQTKEIAIDETILPMRDINNLFTSSKIEKAWSINHSMIHKQRSTEKATRHAVCILDLIMKKQTSS